jgi:PKD repeat protein
MKKLISIFMMLITLSNINAQVKTSNRLLQKEALPGKVTRAMGDTLLYMPLPNMIVNPMDSPLFTYQTEDLDYLTPFNPPNSFEFGMYYSSDSSLAAMGEPTVTNFFHPWETPYPVGDDSAFFWGATSYFTPAGIADNWLSFGPITIPAIGATLKWYDRTRAYRDGYSVKISTSGLTSYTDFTNPAIYTETDAASPSPTYTIDTTWEFKSVAIPASYNGLPIYIAFHHTANDMDMLYLDEITLVEGGLTTSCNANFAIVQDTANLYNYTIYSSASSSGSISYLWDFGDTTTSTLQYPTHTYTGSGPYQICLTVSDTSGCSDTYCDTIVPGMWASAITTVTAVPATTDIVEVLQNNIFDIFPNPVNDKATIRFTLMKEEMVEISIVDLLGKKIAVIEDRNLIAGKKEFNWNAEGLSNGMYLIQIQVGEIKFTKKLIVSKK